MPGGLQVAQDGYRLIPTGTALPVGAPPAVRVPDPRAGRRAGHRLHADHDKDLHLIVVRRDLSGFQHVHPRARPRTAPGRSRCAAAAAGQYRVFADFQPAGRDEPLTLGVGRAGRRATTSPGRCPRRRRTATVDGYTVTLAGDLVPGTASKLTLSVSRDGRPVTDLQPYLGAYGHLVALRDGDLAYLHVHPDGDAGRRPHPGRPGHHLLRRGARPPAATGCTWTSSTPATVRTAEFTALAGGATAPRAAKTPEHTHATGRGAPDCQPRRAVDRRDDLRLLRLPDREEAQPPRRRDGHRQLRHREGRRRVSPTRRSAPTT